MDCNSWISLRIEYWIQGKKNGRWAKKNGSKGFIRSTDYRSLGKKTLYRKMIAHSNSRLEKWDSSTSTKYRSVKKSSSLKTQVYQIITLVNFFIYRRWVEMERVSYSYNEFNSSTARFERLRFF